MTHDVISTRKVFQGKVFSVRSDQVRDESGGVFQVDIVEHSGAVTLVPVTPEGTILFVRQYRHPAGQELLELPAGTLAPGEDPRACAERECREEIGLRPGRIQHLGQVFLAPGYSSELNHIFLAADFTSDPLPQDEDESIQVVPLKASDITSRIARGDLRDAKSLAGLYLALPHLGQDFIPN
jgi:ADP-ribose pyrophosphatase